MVFKVSTHREEIGDPLAMYSVNRDISPNQPLLRMGGKQKDCELDVERSELVEGQIMR